MVVRSQVNSSSSSSSEDEEFLEVEVFYPSSTPKRSRKLNKSQKLRKLKTMSGKASRKTFSSNDVVNLSIAPSLVGASLLDSSSSTVNPENDLNVNSTNESTVGPVKDIASSSNEHKIIRIKLKCKRC